MATSSPITAIIFSIEELHKHFSPLLLTVTSLSVIAAQITSHVLAYVGFGTAELFCIPDFDALAPQMLFTPLLIGIVCGICSILFTRFYHLIDRLMRAVIKRAPRFVLFPLLFACTSVIGFFLVDTLSTGHALTEHLFRRELIWYLLPLIFLVRMITMMISNTSGVTGGVFLPTLAFGGIIGALCGELMIALGAIDATHYALTVVLGVTAFLGATSRIPITACVFALEALGGVNNVLSIMIATVFALVTVELSDLEDFTDTVINAKIHAIRKDKKPSVIIVPLTVKQDSFAVGKELRDILWPNECVILSFEPSDPNREKTVIAEGDVITVHYETYDPIASMKELKALVGEQSEAIKATMNPIIAKS